MERRGLSGLSGSSGLSGLSGLTKQTRQTRATSRLLALHVSRFTDVESAAWGKARPWAKRLSWQTQGGRVK
jgi:hypothetical protein